MNEGKIYRETSNPYVLGELEKKGEDVWFSGKNFAEKMKLMREGLEECYKKGELNRETGLGKLIQEAENFLKPEKKKIKNLSMEEVEKLQEKIKGLSIYAPEAIKIAAEILDKERIH